MIIVHTLSIAPYVQCIKIEIYSRAWVIYYNPIPYFDFTMSFDRAFIVKTDQPLWEWVYFDFQPSLTITSVIKLLQWQNNDMAD